MATQKRPSTFRLDPAVRPTHYTLDLEPDLEAGTFRGRVEIELEIAKSRREITLHAADLAIASAELSEQRKARDADYSINRQHSPPATQQFHGIFLSFSRRPNEPPVQSLIVPAVEFHASRRYTLRAGSSSRAIRHGRLLEQHADWVWTVIDPAAPESDVARTGAAG